MESGTVETFTAPREFMEHPRFEQDRRDSLAALDLGAIDPPIAGIVAGFAELPHCFTLQSCYGHFLCSPGQDPESLDPIPPGHAGPVTYRIAYLAFCIENSPRGLALRHRLARIPEIDPRFVQFGSAGWFWDGWVNSYALQVEPRNRMTLDQVVLDEAEARHAQRTRGLFFQALGKLLDGERRGGRGGPASGTL